MHCEVAGWYHGKKEQHSGRDDELASQTNDLLVIVEEMATLLQEHPSCFLGRHTPDKPLGEMMELRFRNSGVRFGDRRFVEEGVACCSSFRFCLAY